MEWEIRQVDCAVVPVDQGWADPVIPPGNIITYHGALTKELGANADQVRLFMAPGMSQASGAPDPMYLIPSARSMTGWRAVLRRSD